MLLAMMAIAVPATADDIDDLKKKQNIISTQIENLKQSIKKVNKEKKVYQMR